MPDPYICKGHGMPNYMYITQELNYFYLYTHTLIHNTV